MAFISIHACEGIALNGSRGFLPQALTPQVAGRASKDCLNKPYHGFASYFSLFTVAQLAIARHPEIM
jgi:hypothetical protein